MAAAARVHPGIVGLSEGMQGSSLNAGNFKAAKDAWADGEMRPMWESLCQAYSNLVRVPEGARLHYDDRDISFLREDIEQKAKVIAQEADIIQGLVILFAGALEHMFRPAVQTLFASLSPRAVGLSVAKGEGA